MTTSLPGTRPPGPLSARTPEDLLAIAPVVLGFWPEESVVMLTFGAGRPFHARINLPPAPDQTLAALRELSDALFGPARRHGVAQVVLLYFTADPEAAAGAHRALRRAARRAGIEIVTALSADGARYREVSATGRRPGPGVPYDLSVHPFVLQALVTGRLTHRTRDEMVASLAADDAASAAVGAALCRSGLVDAGPPGDGRAIGEQGRWVEGLVRRGVASGRAPTDEELARLLWVMQSVRVRDAAWSLIGRADADAHVCWWSAVLARTPDELVAAPAALLGWACWQAGDGARAWAAVDRCRAADPDYALAAYLAVILDNAVPPDHWESGFDWALGLPE